MKDLTLFYLQTCPYCQRALRYMDELKQEDPRYAALPIHMVEERQQRELANRYDYYYVPCFYLGDDKIAEGSIDKAGVKAVFDKALDS